MNLLRASTGSPRFKVPKTAAEGTEFVFELAVTDASGLTSKDECVVKIIKSFSIASVSETQSNVSDDGAPVSEASNEKTDVVTGSVSVQTEEGTGSADSEPGDQIKTATAAPDVQTDEQNSNNKVPGCPVPVVSMGDEPLLLPVILAVEGFSDSDTGDSHSKTQWQVYRTADKVCVLNTITSSYLTVFRIPEIMLDENTTYFWRARFFDNHDAASDWSKNVSFKTDYSDTDRDGNGVPDDQEVDISVDMNSDEIPDVQQAVVKSVMIPSCHKPIGLSIENANTVSAILSISAVDTVDFDFTPEDEEIIRQLPYGLINFKLAVDRPGDAAVVTVHFSQPVSTSAKWVKFDSVQGVWLDYSAYAEFSDDGMSVSIEFVDGGFGDDDGVANGVIVDPSGLDLSSRAESFSVEVADNLDTDDTDGGEEGDSDNGSGSGSGCFVTGAMEETTAGFPLTAACTLLLLGAALLLSFGDRKLI